LITRHSINWTIVASATPAWAASVFPNDAPDAALAKLWDAIFETTRIDGDDLSPPGRHTMPASISAPSASTRSATPALQYRGPGTDFRLGLADDHLWLGGGTTAGNGLYCIPNMPTEEVFTTRTRTAPTARLQQPSPSHQGTMMKASRFALKTAASWKHAQAAARRCWQKLIDTRRRRGAIWAKWRWVPHSSPIRSSGMIFLNTLFDENAASHIALGQSYCSCLRDGDKLTPEQLAAKGANDSLIHVDG